MKVVLKRNKPADMSDEKFEQAWEASGYLLSSLASTIIGMIEEENKIKAKDFDCPNHYAKLAYQGGKIEALTNILELLPKSSKE